MTVRRITSLARWAFLLLATLLVAGVFPFRQPDASAVVQNAGPLAVTVTPDRNLADGQSVSVHVQAGGGVVIYSISAHTCAPGKVTGDYSFGFLGNFCPNVPIGKGQMEKQVTFPGATSADLQYTVGVGAVSWTNERGFPLSLTCDPTHTCDLVLKIEIPNDTVYARAPLCYGTDCPVVVVDPGSSGAGGGGTGAATAGAAAGAGQSGTGSGPTPAANVSGSGSTPTATPAGSGTAHSSANGGTSRSTSDPNARRSLDHATNASVTTSIGDSSRGTRVFVAAIAGAIGGAHIVSVLSRARRRTGMGLA